MVLGYDPDAKSHSTFFHHFSSGLLSGIVTRAALQPLDVLKIRFQLQSESKNLKYRRIYQSVRTIFSEEGFTAFWKGHLPAQLLSMVYGAVQFSAFEYYTEILHEVVPHSRQDIRLDTLKHTICGGTAAVTATIAAQPLDVLRTRFVAQKEPKMYNSLTRAAFAMIKNEGLFSLYRGLTPSVIQIIPFGSLQFGSRSFFESVWIKLELTEGILSEFVCGSFAGLFAKTCVYPLDVVKKRLQVQGFIAPTASSIPTYQGLFHCCRIMLHHEGLAAFYKGFAVAALKSALVSGISFTSYRAFKDMTNNKNTRDG